VGARISIQEGDGRMETKETEGLDLEFCDLGITPVTITVGHPACNQAIVRNVGVNWNQTTRTTIIYDRQPCLQDAPPVAACQMLFRFQDSQQHWLDKASLDVESPKPETVKADKFGRILVRIVARQTLRGRAVAEGYRPSVLSVECSREHIQFEQIVTLDRASK
jgi:hypothetical protein